MTKEQITSVETFLDERFDISTLTKRTEDKVYLQGALDALALAGVEVIVKAGHYKVITE